MSDTVPGQIQTLKGYFLLTKNYLLNSCFCFSFFSLSLSQRKKVILTANIFFFSTLAKTLFPARLSWIDCGWLKRIESQVTGKPVNYHFGIFWHDILDSYRNDFEKSVYSIRSVDQNLLRSNELSRYIFVSWFFRTKTFRWR